MILDYQSIYKQNSAFQQQQIFIMEAINNEEKESEYFPKKNAAVRRSNINKEQLHDSYKKSQLQSLGRTQLSPTRKITQRIWKNTGQNKSQKKNIIFGCTESENVQKVAENLVNNTSTSIQINQFNKQYIGYTNTSDSMRYLNQSAEKNSKVNLKQRLSKHTLDNNNQYQNSVNPGIQTDQKTKKRVDLSCTSERLQRKEILRKFSKKSQQKYIKLQATMQQSKQGKDWQDTIQRIQKQSKGKKYEDIEYKSKSRQKNKKIFFLMNQKLKIQTKESYNSLHNSKQYFTGKQKKQVATTINSKPIFQIKHSNQQLEGIMTPIIDITKKISSYIISIDSFAKLGEDTETHQSDRFWYCKTHLAQREILQFYLNKLYKKVQKSKNEDNVKKLYMILQSIRRDNQTLHQNNNKNFSKYLNAEEAKSNKNNKKDIAKRINAQIDILKKKNNDFDILKKKNNEHAQKIKIKLLYNCLDAIEQLRQGKIEKQLEDIYF